MSILHVQLQLLLRLLVLQLGGLIVAGSGPQHAGKPESHSLKVTIVHVTSHLREYS